MHNKSYECGKNKMNSNLKQAEYIITSKKYFGRWRILIFVCFSIYIHLAKLLGPQLSQVLLI